MRRTLLAAAVAGILLVFGGHGWAVAAPPSSVQVGISGSLDFACDDADVAYDVSGTNTTVVEDGRSRFRTVATGTATDSAGQTYTARFTSSGQIVDGLRQRSHITIVLVS